jgi:hypothetical protein
LKNNFSFSLDRNTLEEIRIRPASSLSAVRCQIRLRVVG